MQYNTKKQAQRAAKDQGLSVDDVFNHDGKWVIGIPSEPAANENVELDGMGNPLDGGPMPEHDPVPAWAQEAAVDYLERLASEDEQPSAEEIDAELDKAVNLVSEEPVTDIGPAVVENEQIQIVHPTGSTPFAIIWSFLALNSTLSRKIQTEVLKSAYGLNENTVRTQISRYYKVGGDKAKLLAGEKAKRDAERAHIAQLVAEIRAKREADAAAAAVKPTDGEPPVASEGETPSE